MFLFSSYCTVALKATWAFILRLTNRIRQIIFILATSSILYFPLCTTANAQSTSDISLRAEIFAITSDIGALARHRAGYWNGNFIKDADAHGRWLALLKTAADRQTYYANSIDEIAMYLPYLNMGNTVPVDKDLQITQLEYDNGLLAIDRILEALEADPAKTRKFDFQHPQAVDAQGNPLRVPINCKIAYDAGFIEAYENPESHQTSSHNEGVTDLASLSDAIKACLSGEDNKEITHQSYMAGIHDGKVHKIEGPLDKKLETNKR